MKSTAIVGAMTLISRILGFVRDMLIARHFGADAATDAFFVAFRIPNFLRRLFAEGSFSQAFVPLLSSYQQTRSNADQRAMMSRVAGSLAVLLCFVSLLGILASPLLILLFAPGFLRQPDSWALSVDMLRITLPYLFFITLTALAGSILNSRGHFAIPAITPALLNLVMIAATLWLAPQLGQPVTALAWGVLAAGMLQLTLQLPALAAAGLLARPRCRFADPEVQRVLKAMAPALFGVSVTQVNLLVDTLIASFLISGSVSWLYYSDRLVEFPLGLFGVAIGTAILPQLSRQHIHRDPSGFSAVLDWGLRWVLLIGFPATVGLIILAKPLVSTLFQHDAFDSQDVEMASRSLMAYGLGLPAFIAVKVLTPGFSARHDLRTPVRLGVIAMLVNAVLGAGLGYLLSPTGWGHAALALATALAAVSNAWALFLSLLKQGILRVQRGWRTFLLRLTFANGLLGLCLMQSRETPWQSLTLTDRTVELATWILAGIAIYFAALWLLGMRPRHLLVRVAT